MKILSWIEQGESNEVIEMVMTDKEVLSMYFPHWAEQMIKVGRGDQVNEEDCIADFAVVHWATIDEIPL